MNKKIILGLGTMTVAMAPIITVVSCGGGDDSTESGSGIRPIVAGAKVVTTNVPGIHFECSGFDNYLVIDGSKITPEEFANINPSSLQLSGGSAGQIQSAITNHQMPVLRVINAPDQSGYYDVLGIDQPVIPQDQGTIQGTAQGNGVRGTTIQGYNDVVPQYNVAGKWYTDLSQVSFGTSSTPMIAKSGSNVYASDSVRSIDDIRGVDPVSNLTIDSLPDTINVDGNMISKFNFAETSNQLNNPGYYEKSVSITNAGTETPLSFTSLFEADGMFFETKDEAALHLGYTKEASFDAYASRRNATGVKVVKSNGSVTSTIAQGEGYNFTALQDASRCDYFSVDLDSNGYIWAIDSSENFARNFNAGSIARINNVNIDEQFTSSHQTFVFGKPTIMNNAVSENNPKTYAYKVNEDGEQVTLGFYEHPPHDASATPFNLASIHWSFEGKYYTDEEAFMSANGYSTRDVFTNEAGTSFVDEVRPRNMTLEQIAALYNVGDKISINGQEYTIA